MPRTLPAALTTAMDAGIYEPYLRVHINTSASDSGATTKQPKGFKLEATRAIIEVEYYTTAPDEGYFRIERGAVINGTPSTISSIWFSIVDFIYDGKFITYFGEALDRTYLTVAANSTYQTVIETALTDIGSDPADITPSYEGASTWKAYKFYPAGKTIVLSPRTKLFTILRQKYLVFAAEDGWNGTISSMFFFVATQTRATDYTVVDPLMNFNFHTEIRQVIWRDEAATVHNIGPATAIIHNLGYLESTAADPIDAVDPSNGQLGSHTSKIRVHLKYRTGDQVRIENADASWQVTGRVKVTEVLDLKSTPAWYQVLERLDYFTTTEGGAMPSTIENAAPYTPLATGNFDHILSTNDNNLQAAMETIDDHTHTGTTVNLTNSNISPTTADTNAAANNRYFANISGLTASRNFILPVPAIGDQIEINIITGDDTYALILKGAATVTINKGSSATEWSRLFITGETARLIADTVTNWQVVTDGRIPCKAAMHRGSNQTGIVTATATKVNLDTSDKDNAGGQVDTTNNRINIRRAGVYTVPGVVVDSLSATATRVISILYKNGAQISTAEGYGVNGSFPAPWVHSPALDWAAGDYAELYGYQNSGVNSTFIGGALSGGPCQLALIEQIP